MMHAIVSLLFIAIKVFSGDRDSAAGWRSRRTPCTPLRTVMTSWTMPRKGEADRCLEEGGGATACLGNATEAGVLSGRSPSNEI